MRRENPKPKTTFFGLSRSSSVSVSLFVRGIASFCCRDFCSISKDVTGWIVKDRISIILITSNIRSWYFWTYSILVPRQTGIVDVMFDSSLTLSSFEISVIDYGESNVLDHIPSIPFFLFRFDSQHSLGSYDSVERGGSIGFLYQNQPPTLFQQKWNLFTMMLLRNHLYYYY